MRISNVLSFVVLFTVGIVHLTEAATADFTGTAPLKIPVFSSGFSELPGLVLPQSKDWDGSGKFPQCSLAETRNPDYKIVNTALLRCAGCIFPDAAYKCSEECCYGQVAYHQALICNGPDLCVRITENGPKSTAYSIEPITAVPDGNGKCGLLLDADADYCAYLEITKELSDCTGSGIILPRYDDDDAQAPTSCGKQSNNTSDATSQAAAASTTEPEMEASSESEEEEDDDSQCFPASATITLRDGSIKAMEKLEIGDRVLSSAGVYSEVFSFTHKDASIVATFLRIRTASGASLSATPGHYIYIGSDLVAMSDIAVGDSVTLASGATDTVVSVEMERSTGLFNPQTVHGDIVVNGIVASTYTTAVCPQVAHALLTPLRRAFTWLGVSAASLESGSSSGARFMPSGSAAY